MKLAKSVRGRKHSLADSEKGRGGPSLQRVTHQVFVTGGTGYIGGRLIPLLNQRGHSVKALARKGSEAKLPVVATCVTGDALRVDSYTEQVRGADTFVHLVGVAHPSPA
jgi:uncharacterized protein YbjT (DUF2867 family)